MRSVLDQDQFTPFGLWIRQYLRKSESGLSITNLDYVLEDFRNKKIMLLEEKQNSGSLGYAQKLTFKVIDHCLHQIAINSEYEYWGFYILQFPLNANMPGPGMRLNGRIITSEQLVNHLNFINKFCDSFKL